MVDNSLKSGEALSPRFFLSRNRLNHVNKRKKERNNNTYSEWEPISRLLPPLVEVQSATQPNGDATAPDPALPPKFKRKSK